jgi:hypothetical protein
VPTEWPALISRTVEDISRIVQAEIHLAEIGIKSIIEQEIDRAIKAVIALSFLICAAVCALGAAIIGLHDAIGLWWAAFAIVAGAAGIAGIGFFLLAMQRKEDPLQEGRRLAEETKPLPSP